MPNPILQVPDEPLFVDDGTTAAAEGLLQTLLQVFRAGTTGSSTPTPATLLPVPNTVDQYEPLKLETAQQQLFYRQLFMVLAAKMGAGALPEFEASCTASEKVGDIVRSVQSSKREVAKADPTIIERGKAVGVILRKPSNTTAVVRNFGPVLGVFSGLEAGAPYFLGLDGRPSKTPPTPPAGKSVFVQEVGVAIDSTSLLVSIDPHRFVKKG